MFFLLRKIGALLRGKVTPFQIVTGCALGAMLGFMPDFAIAPGLVVALTLALTLINANLLLAGLVGLAAKLLSLLLLPVSFQVGRVLLDGPTEGIFKSLIKAPVFALFGFESYVATGGLLIGALLGLGFGLLISRTVSGFREKMTGLSQDSARYQKLMGKKWMRFGVFVLAGGGMKKPDYAALLEKRTGNPIRPLGAVLVVLSLILAVVVYQFFTGTIITTALRSGLEQANGATVDISAAEIDLKAARMTLTGLAIADPNALGNDLFRAERIEADISGVNLLRKRLQLDRVVITGATSGKSRKVPGRRTATATKQVVLVPVPDAQGIDDYLQNAKIWRERLAQAKQWLDKIKVPAAESAENNGPTEEGLEARLRRLAEAQGYARLRATHLIEGAPSLMILELQANLVTVAQLPGEMLNLVAHNLSTQPSLATEAPEIAITSASDKIAFSVKLGRVGHLAFHYRGLLVDSVMPILKSTKTTLKGGTIDLAANGSYLADGTIDLPVAATIRNSTLSLGGRDTNVPNFTLPIGLTGSLDNPRIKVDAKSLGNLALKAGTDALKEKATEKLKDKAGGLLNSLLGGKK
jgi:uncharacterized protein (TIGR03546 family)|uniref:hypothetical protein n=1 Tax=Cephaloticoccus sp. TaxID=1985742 RepID=UPI0040493234